MKPSTVRAISMGLALALLGSAPQAEAGDPFSCRARLLNVIVYYEGSVAVIHDQRNAPIYVCNLNTPYKGVVSTSTCAMWTSLLFQLKNEGKRADFFYYGQPTAMTCATIPQWDGAPAPAYVAAAEDVPPAVAAKSAQTEQPVMPFDPAKKPD